ncbi:MAG: hypothetical protein AVDCRST_MAG02-2535 [uncultured Rubrobacteraceae bacterium]|uniref:Uncharacterized protein n=1 Tax=uncultured Rubrobacteraceae bacterium TaxID=349277 RepID=A0A6J4R5Y0_9ACTN|nr:MAG: hypothetical protein AVDCRST_MAG02-2535 [uncultured Rubrobacteraceae bacterium]
MLTLCGGCGHRLWAEIRNAGAFRFLARFDDDEGSATYADHSPSCPTCGLLPDVRPRAGQGHSRPRGARGTPPPGRVARSIFYSPECVEGKFPELRA